MNDHDTPPLLESAADRVDHSHFLDDGVVFHRADGSIVVMVVMNLPLLVRRPF